jgi:peptidoglycan/LPS O-acetylase OafA/YrhL
VIGPPPSQTMPAPDPAVNQRLHALDGLRGIAALVVLICHSFLLKTELALAYLNPAAIESGTIWWWAAFSPLHVLWAGTEAVYLFFILSGYVLTLPFARGTDRGWIGYFPKRLIRLYVPVWGAFALAVMWINVLPRRFAEGTNGWLQAHQPELTGSMVRSDLLLFPYPGFSNSALWTLRYEVMFSMLLPIYVLVGIRFPKLNLLKAVGLMGAIVYFSEFQSSFRFYLPMFGLGVLMAVEHERLAKLGAAIHNLRYSKWVWAGLSIAALLMLNSYWTVRGLNRDINTLAFQLRTALVLMMLGGCLLIFVAVQCSERSWLATRPARWLGTRSFSLYLVHEPIVVSTAVLLGAGYNPALAMAVAVSVSLVIAELFHRVIERPSQRLGKAVERKIGSRRRQPEPAKRVPPPPEPVVAGRAPSGV